MAMFSAHGSRILRHGFPCALTRRNISKTQKLPYTQEQKCQVLSMLNSGSQQELKKFVGATTLRRLMDYRERHGTFQSFESVLSIEGLALHNLQNFCNKILMINDKTLAMASGIIPTLSKERIQSIENVVSVNLDPPFLTYVKMDRANNVLDWRRFMFADDAPRKSRASLNNYYRLAALIYPQLPQADIFIMESASDRSNGSQSVDKQTLQVILYTMMSFGEPDQPKVVQIKLSTLSSYFGLNMGSDRISCQETFHELTEKLDIKLPVHLKLHYDRQNNVQREFLGLNALQCFAFLKACSAQ